MILKQSKIIDPGHPDLLKLRRGIVEKTLWLTLIFCIIIIGLLTAGVFYYKMQIENMPSSSTVTTSDTFSRIGGRYLASVFLSKMNFSVDPCDDFYEFACGRFIKNTIIPDDAGSVNTINMIEGRVLGQLHTLLNNEIHKDELRPFKMVKQMYKQCMNTEQIEKTSLDYVKRKLNLAEKWPVLQKQGEWDEKSMNETDYHRYNVNFFIDNDLKNTSRRIIYVSEANLGLSRDMLMNGFQDNIVRAYHRYMVNVSVYFGANKTQAEQDFAKVIIFEMLLANITMPKEELRDSNKLYNPTTFAVLYEKYPYIDWLPYINSKLYSDLTFNESDSVILQAPTYYDQLEDVLNKTDKRTIANHIIWRELSDYVSYLTNDLREFEFEFFKSFSGRSTKPSRWSECIKSVSNMLNVAVSSMYVREHFYDRRIKEDVANIVTEISSEFEKLLYLNTWMDKQTKAEALKKLNSLNSNIAYPSELLNDTIIENFYKDLTLNSPVFLESAIEIDLHSKKYLCSRFHEPVKRNDWVDHATSIYVNANYHGKSNSIQIIAAILQGHFYSSDRPFFMNFASIGYVIGHEITHAFDDLGRLYDAEGNLRDWWNPETAEAFKEKKKCIIEQYGNFTDKSTNMKINGITSQGENIADTAGLKLAYRAYKSALNKMDVIDPSLPGLPYTPEQLFWLSAAQTWCSVERPEVKKLLILTDNHALSQFRVLGTFSNSKEFANDFKCADGSKMNPIEKCEVW
ncbi:hypothetical protein PVAND_011159 [Polypedilum vanderplanki]|uniref:Neprilysin n=1 Tax=Polypedilum vanderplanki TaxID=319348 RepID=A0A9J6CJK0_POLVA|nr:hypothetical protein PVAND_011159 [Polypedilum vanderplanki]